MTEKIEPQLAEEMRLIEEAGEPEREIPVIIQHAGTSEAGPRMDYQELAERVRAGQRELRERLSTLGIKGEVRQITLANALEARLTPAQIREVASHPDVKRIVFNREEYVVA